MSERDFIDYLRELFEPMGSYAARAMFGGWGVYLDGVIVGLVDEGLLYLKTDALTQAAFAGAGSKPFVYESKDGPMTMSYWSVPDEALDGADPMRPWLRLAVEAAQRKRAAKPPARAAKQAVAKAPATKGTARTKKAAKKATAKKATARRQLRSLRP